MQKRIKKDPFQLFKSNYQLKNKENLDTLLPFKKRNLHLIIKIKAKLNL